MRILMVGAGATGGFYGGLLLKAGRDVTFLVRSGRARQIRAHGLEVLTHTGEHLVLHPPLVSAEDLRQTRPHFDLVVISTKSYQLAGAMDDIAPVVDEGTMLLPILNGMHQFAVLDERFGKERVLGGSVRIVSDLDEHGRIHQMNALDQMNYGERSGERTARILAVDAAMQGAGFEATLQPDILNTLWQKWVLLASMGAICVLARGNAGQVAQAPYGDTFAQAVIAECAAIATRNGYAPDPALVSMHVKRMVEPGSTLTSSMYRDMSKGAPVEADHVLGDLLSRAQGVAAPLLTAAYVQLKIYEGQRV